MYDAEQFYVDLDSILYIGPIYKVSKIKKDTRHYFKIGLKNGAEFNISFDSQEKTEQVHIKLIKKLNKKYPNSEIH